jgi:[NiFe] hydrogenase large subunit/hydrogenase large subunit
VHAIASIRAVEGAIGAVPPPNARILRNLIIAAQNVMDHVVHFYHLHAFDWVDVVSSLKADPAKTATLAQSISDWPLSSTTYFAGVQQRMKAFVRRGQLGIFAKAYWGHPAYQLPPEANLLGVAHYLEALDWQRRFIRIVAVPGGKNPHPQSFLVGGMATPVDPGSQVALSMDTIESLRKPIADAKGFVGRVYIPGVLAIPSYYKDWAAIGGGARNYMAYDDYPEDDSPIPRRLYRPASSVIVTGQDRHGLSDPDHRARRPLVVRYADSEAAALNPSLGETNPHYTGPNPLYKSLDVEQKYSRLKSRYDGAPVGPLARMLLAYNLDRPARAKELIHKTLSTLGVGPQALFSTLGRITARAIEAQVLVEAMDRWVSDLADNMGCRDYRIQDHSKWEPATWPSDCLGYGFHEAPRRSLRHWVHIRNGAP